MAGSVLTPLNIWSDFKFLHQPSCEIIGEYREKKISITRYYIQGESVDNESVKIYGTLARDITKEKMSGIFVVQEFMDGADESLITYLAKKGYAAFTFDFAGDGGEKKNFTSYPESLSYVNYKNCKDNLTAVEGDVLDTCWYRWGITVRYAFDFFAKQEFVSKIGVVGIGQASTCLWHLPVAENRIDCGVFLMNAGWTAYHGEYKNSEQSEKTFSEDKMKYVAGIDPQSYATHIKFPTLIVSPTNSNEFDCDRAYDTLIRLNSKYKAINYSIGLRDSVGRDAVDDIKIFFSKYLTGRKKSELPSDVQASLEIKKDFAVATVNVDKTKLDGVEGYFSEGVVDPAVRSWVKAFSVEDENGNYVFKYQPYSKSKHLMFFAKAVYKDGYSISSNITSVDFDLEEIKSDYPSNIIYSSRNLGEESIFSAAVENAVRPTGINISKENVVRLMEGPMGIQGVNCFGGVVTFRINSERFRPKEDAVLMLDVYAKEESVLTVKLISDYFGDKKEYFANVNLAGGEVWQNVKFEMSNFRTEDGIQLKGYQRIQALEIDSTGMHLINNVLWV